MSFHKIEFRASGPIGGSIFLDGAPLKGVTRIEIVSCARKINVVRLEMLAEEIVCQLDEATIESSRRVAKASSGELVEVTTAEDEHARFIRVDPDCMRAES